MPYQERHGYRGRAIEPQRVNTQHVTGSPSERRTELHGARTAQPGSPRRVLPGQIFRVIGVARANHTFERPRRAHAYQDQETG